MGGSYSAPKEVKSKLWDTYRDKIGSQDGKVILITGCTTGTGYHAARFCGEKGAQVVMLNRKSARADSALEALKKEFPSGKFELVECDLMSFVSVRKAAEEVKGRCAGGIDVLCLNAGIMAMPDAATEDGFDTQMQTNHLSHWVLSAELWPLLEKAAESRGESRIVFHSSSARKLPSTKISEKHLEKNGGKLGGDGTARWARYNQTKLANAVCAFALADKLTAAGSKVKSLVAAPGLASTNLQVTTSSAGGMGGRMTSALMGMLAQSAEDGTLPLLMCMLSPEANTGELWEPSSIFNSSGVPKPIKREKKIDSQENKTTLWKKSVEATGMDIKISGAGGA